MPIGRAWFLLTRTRQIYHRKALSLRFLASEFLGSDLFLRDLTCWDMIHMFIVWNYRYECG